MADVVPTAAARRPGPDRLLEAATLSIERMPMLRVVFDRALGTCTDTLQRMSGTSARYSVEELKVLRIGDVVDACDENILPGVLWASAWEAHVLVCLDRAFLYTLIETLYGGDSAEPPIDDRRPYTNIDKKLAHLIFEGMAGALQKAFQPVAETPFVYQRMEERGDFGFLGKRSSFCVAARVAIKSLGRTGKMLIVIPQTALTPALPNLARPSTEPAAGEPNWSRQFETEVGRATVTLQAIIDGRDLTLGELTELRVGQVLPLPTLAQNHVRLESKGKQVFWCQLGQADGFYTLRIENPVDEEQEFMNDILPE